MRRRALLIGIDAYSKRLVKSPPLMGAVNDVQRLARRLWQRGDDVRLLIDERASRDAILSALDILREDCVEGDRVLVHFSGYGSWVRAKNGVSAEEGGDLEAWPTAFETLVPFDGTRQSRPALRDVFVVEVEDWAEALREDKVEVELVFDTAFASVPDSSEAGSGSEVGQRRFVQPDERPLVRLLGKGKKASRLPDAVATRLSAGPTDQAKAFGAVLNAASVGTALRPELAEAVEERPSGPSSVPVHGRLSWSRIDQLLQELGEIAPVSAGLRELDFDTERPTSPRRHALLIGINRYPNIPDQSGRDLAGCLNDVQLMLDLLRPVGFEVELLLGDYATRDGIRQAVEGLIQRVGSGDTVVLYFSGHGSTLRGRSGHVYQTLVTGDSGRDSFPNRDLLDVEVQLWLRRLSRQAGDVTLLVDCCHSGGLSRSGDPGVRVRSISQDDRPPESWEQVVGTEEEVRELVTPGEDTRSGSQGSGDTMGWGRGGWRVLSACGADELAIERSGPRTGDLAHGIFTYSLASVLEGYRTVPWEALVWDKIVELDLRPAMRNGEPRPRLDDGRERAPEIEIQLERHALVVGIDTYDPELHLQPLATARADAEALAELLPRLGFPPDNITLLVDEEATFEAFVDRLEALKGQLPEASALVVYFAGHAEAQVQGGFDLQGYLLPHGAHGYDVKTWLPMETVRRLLGEVESRHLLVILDCCFAGAFRWTKRSVPRNQPFFRSQYRRALERGVRQVLTSAAHDELASDGGTEASSKTQSAERDRGKVRLGDGREHSPFAAALLEGLTGSADLVGDGMLTAGELHLFVAAHLARQRGLAGRQTPGLSYLDADHVGRQFVFPRPGVLAQVLDDPVLDPEAAPWCGLRPYGRDDADVFFGRDRLVEDLVRRLESGDEPKALALVGAAGSGKTSLVQAGLLPSLAKSPTTGWQVIEIPQLGSGIRRRLEDVLGIPRRAKPRAMEAAENHWQRKLRELGLRKKEPAEAVETPAKACAGPIVAQTPEPGDDRPLRRLFVVDPVDRLLSLDVPASERRALYRLLRDRLAAGDRLLVVLRRRTETRFLGSWKVGVDVVRVDRPSLDELREIIEGPAQSQALLPRQEVVTQVLDDLREVRWPLALLSLVLNAMFQRARQRIVEEDRSRELLLADYHAVGGVQGVVSHEVERILASLDERGRVLLRELVFRMVSLGRSGLHRRWVDPRELEVDDPEVQRQIETLIAGLEASRFLTRDDRGGIEISSALLLEGWPRVHRWLESTAVRQWIQFQEEVWDDSQRWDRRRSWRRLYATADPRLDRLEPMRPRLNRIERAFLDAGLRKRRWLRGLALTAVMLLVGGLVFTVADFYLDLFEMEYRRQLVELEFDWLLRRRSP